MRRQRRRGWPPAIYPPASGTPPRRRWHSMRRATRSRCGGASTAATTSCRRRRAQRAGASAPRSTCRRAARTPSLRRWHSIRRATRSWCSSTSTAATTSCGRRRARRAGASALRSTCRARARTPPIRRWHWTRRATRSRCGRALTAPTASCGRRRARRAGASVLRSTCRPLAGTSPIRRWHWTRRATRSRWGAL